MWKIFLKEWGTHIYIYILDIFLIAFIKNVKEISSLIFLLLCKTAPWKLPTPENCPLKNCPPENCHLWELPSMKIPTYESFPLWKFPPKLPPRKLTPRKLSSMKVATIVVRNWKMLPCCGGHGFRGSTDTYLIWHG